MFKGFLSGLFWGGMVGALVLAVLSLYAPLPASQEEARLNDGANTEADVQTPDPAPSAEANPTETEQSETVQEPTVETSPEAVETSPEADDAQSGALELETEATVSEFVQTSGVVDGTASDIVIDQEETAAAVEGAGVIEIPETLDVASLDTAPQVASETDVPSFNDTIDVQSVKLPQVTATQTQTPTVPNGIATVETALSDQPLMASDKPIEALPVQILKTAPGSLGFGNTTTTSAIVRVAGLLDTPPKTITTALSPPVSSELAPKPVLNPDFERVSENTTLRTSRLPQVGVPQPAPQPDDVTTEASANTPIGVPIEPIENPIETPAVGIVTQVVTGRLPTIGTAPDTPLQPTFQTNTPSVEPPSQGALTDYAVAFETNSQSLFSVIIIDIGNEGVAREQLLNSSYPITVAIDPSLPGAAGVMSQYRAAGIEVVALLNDLPLSAAPTDVAVAVEGYFNVVDEAVAVMEPLDRRLQNNRNLLAPVLGAIAGSGHGLMTYAQGLNTTQQAAKREGVPSAAIFRVLDADGEGAPKIKRYLKRAAFNASKDGSVVVVGRSYDDTMTAILEWALENNDASISLAPISAILKADLAQGS